MTDTIHNTILPMTDTTAEPEDYTGEDGLLYCGKCRKPKEAYFPEGKTFFGRDRHPSECDCQRAARKEREAAEKRRSHLETVERLKRQGFTDKTMQDWTFANDNGSCPQMKNAAGYVARWEQIKDGNYGLLLWGRVGTGKSYFAGCIANALMEQEVPVCMTNFATILNDLAARAPGMFLNNAPEGAGKWRIAQMPTWNAGENVSSEYGGSSLALMSSSKNADAAYKFMEFASTNSDAIMSRVNQGGFPADLKTMSNDEFLNQTTMVNSDGDTVDYFGGEKFNAEFAEAAKHVTSKFEFLPYDVYARSVFTDTVGAAYMGQTTMKEGVKAWQDKLVEQGKSQGFTVNE